MVVCVDANQSGEGCKFGRHVAQRHPCFHVEIANGTSGKFHCMALAAAGACCSQQVEQHVLCGNAGGQCSVIGYTHGFGLHDAQRAGDHRMFGLAAADAPRHGAKCALRTGVAVGCYQGAARQNNAQFGRDDMGNALIAVGHIEQGDARRPTSGAGLCDEILSTWHHGQIASPRAGIDDMIHHGKNARGVGDRSLRRRQAFEGGGTCPFVQEYAVDSDQGAAIAEIDDGMGVPDFVKQGPGVSQRRPPFPRQARASHG